ncbi:hypothetical protein [Terriglobus tenax]|uniref:hypothetical protein n=1 Tax=Terriglobus tenax TaxID=1111115 RepID=UPI0021DF89B0|nr:hypothetical protein [Terriglobus tenax]
MSLLRGALRRFSLKLLLLQIGLALVVFLMALLWLRLPDASVLWVIVSFVFGLLIAAVAGAGQSWIALWVARQTCKRKRLLAGSIAIVAAVAVWLLATHWIEPLHSNDFQRASYLNSQTPRSLRYFFTFDRIYKMLDWLWSTLSWIIVSVLTVFSFAVILGRVRGALRSLFSLTWWVVFLALTWLASAVTGWILGWVPGRGLKVEALSLVARLLFVVLFDGLVASFLLALLAETQATPGGMPETSQPRTEANP